MATPEPNYFSDAYRVTAKGKEYVYAWRNGPRLPGAYGSPESISAWLDEVSRRKLGDKATIRGLITEFKSSERWQGTASARKSYSPATKAGYSFYLDRIEAKFGDMTLRSFERREIREVIALWRRDTFTDSPRNADYAITVLRLLLNFGIRTGRLGENHAKAMESIYESDRSDMIWEDAELDALEQCASAEIWRAAKLASLTGLRRADLLTLQWPQIKTERIDMRTSKSRGRNRASVPMYDELRDFLATIPRLTEGPGKDYVLVTKRGQRPWGQGFSSSWDKALAATVKVYPQLEASLKALHFHDLRGNAATMFYAAGFKPHEIARFMGWKEAAVLDLLDRYVSDKAVWAARAKRLASTTIPAPANDAERGFAKPFAKPA